MEEKAKIKEMIEQAERHQTRFETQETIDMLKKVYRDLEVLEQYKTIEEEIGVDLITLFNALKNGIYVEEQNTNSKEIVFEQVNLCYDCKVLLFRQQRQEIGKGRVISQYGKTWALTKEELENDK